MCIVRREKIESETKVQIMHPSHLCTLGPQRLSREKHKTVSDELAMSAKAVKGENNIKEDQIKSL